MSIQAGRVALSRGPLCGNEQERRRKKYINDDSWWLVL
jgi:hypothetical protein